MLESSSNNSKQIQSALLDISDIESNQPQQQNNQISNYSNVWTRYIYIILALLCGLFICICAISLYFSLNSK